MKSTFKMFGTIAAIAMLAVIFTFTACKQEADTSSDTVIKAVAIVVTAPATGQAPVTTAPAGGTGYTCSAVTWTPSAGTFAPDTQYTASVTLAAAAGYTFTGGLSTATINGQAATKTDNTGKAVKLSYQFPATGSEPAEQLDLTDLFNAPANRAVPVRSFISEKYNGTINWYTVVGAAEFLIGTNEIFAGDNGAAIKAVVTLDVNGGFEYKGEDFYYTGSTSVSVSVSDSSVIVTIIFAPIPEPAVYSRWYIEPKDPNPVPDESHDYWITFYDDDTFVIFNSYDNKEGVAMEGTCILEGVDGKTGGDKYTMFISWVEAYAALSFETKDKHSNELLIYVGDEVGKERPSPESGKTIKGNNPIYANIFAVPDGLNDGEYTGPALRLGPRWQDTPILGYVEYALYD